MYREIQKFRQPWLWAILLGSLGVVLYRRDPVAIGVMGGVLALFWFLQLETVINEEGIAYRWLPFQRSYALVKWTDIEAITVRPYLPVGEFGGWGIRFGWGGTAYTVSGNWGIEIKGKGKKRFLLLGTQRPDEVRKAIKAHYWVTS